METMTALEENKQAISHEARAKIAALENAMSKVEGVTFGDSDLMPLKHSFAEGVYVREIFIPKGTVLTGKIHRHSHPNFLMKGEVLVYTEFGGTEHLKAPMSMISKAGTKRAIVALEDTVWITVHVTHETDLQKIEDYVIAPSYDDLLPTGEKPMIESELTSKNCLILALKAKERDFACLLGLVPVGILLPFRPALESLKEAGISLHGLFAEKQANGIWHVDLSGDTPLESVAPSDSELVGTWVAVAVGGSAALGAGVSLYQGSKKVKQAPLETPEQAAARRSLYDFGATGRLGNYKAGEAYTGSLGDSGISALEQSGIDLATGRVGGTESTFNDLLNTDKYDPLKTGGVYDQLRGRIQRTTRDATDAYKRSSAYTGNLYSTDANRGLADVQARGAETEAVTMANLYDQYIGRRLAAVPMQEDMTRGRMQDAFAYGGLPRNLRTAEANAKYGEYQRQRNEEAGRLTALSSVAGTPSNFGVAQVQGQSPWLAIMTALSQFGGSYLGSRSADRTAGNGGSPQNSGLPMGMI